MVTGSNGRYRWLADERNGIGRLIERCPEALLGRYLVVACFDSGPLRPNAQETAAGWSSDGQLAYSPRLESLSLLPPENFDASPHPPDSARAMSSSTSEGSRSGIQRSPWPLWILRGTVSARRCSPVSRSGNWRSSGASWSCSALSHTSPTETTSSSPQPTPSCTLAEKSRSDLPSRDGSLLASARD